MTTIHKTAVVDSAAEIGNGVDIGPFCMVGADAVIGDNVRLRSHVIVEGHTTIGADCDIHPFTTLGSAPQHTGYADEPTRLVIGARNVIRENVTMNRGTLQGGGETRVGDDSFYMAYSHVAHDCHVGNRVTFANCATLGGHTSVGDFVIIGGLAAVHQNCRIGAGAFIGGLSGVTKDVIPFGSVVGDRAELAGLNIVGLKRRGHDRQSIHGLRNAYKMIFSGSGTLQDRAQEAVEAHTGNELVAAMVDFLKSGSGRAFCTPRE